MWERCGRGVGEVWERCERGVGEVWERCGRGVGEMWEKCGRGVGEVWWCGGVAAWRSGGVAFVIYAKIRLVLDKHRIL